MTPSNTDGAGGGTTAARGDAPAGGDRRITDLLVSWGRGDEGALSSLVPLVYQELRLRAANRLRKERPGFDMQTTELVHEVYLRLVDQNLTDWKDRSHFYAIAALMIRRVVVDHARSLLQAKHGGGAPHVELEESVTAGRNPEADLVALDAALSDLAAANPELSRVVELKFFGGLTNEEVASILGLSVPTVVRRWRLARAWLHRYLARGKPPA